MRSWLINKNIVLYYRLRRIIGKHRALPVASFIELCIVTALGRDELCR